MKSVKSKKKVKKEILKFGLIGVLNTILSVFLMYVFYNIFALGYWGASSLSYLFSSLISFFLNKKLTFKNSHSYLITTPKFFVNIIICYSIAYLIAKPSIDFFLELIQINEMQIIEQVAMLFGISIFTILNFFGQKYFVFNEK